jgi:bifunctional UDP-N-acetylglucosamine pyrophosphorylase/glucosamine-1-phosphate N-acetyltransferase
MKSDRHKVLHPIAGRAMLDHLLESVDALVPRARSWSSGAGREQVEPVVAARGGEVVVQDPQLGTGPCGATGRGAARRLRRATC